MFLDALVVRCLLLPATLDIIGRVTWLLPARLDRLLPRLNVEGTLHRDADDAQEERGPVAAPGGAGARGRGGVATEGAEG